MQDRQDSIYRGQPAAMLLLQVAETLKVPTLLNRQSKADNNIALIAVDLATTYWVCVKLSVPLHTRNRT